MLEQLVAEKWLRRARSSDSFAAASSGDDDIACTPTIARSRVVLRLHQLRQQKLKAAGQAQLCLADFVAPVAAAADYIGAFAVTAGIGIEAHVARFEAAHDDYSSIMLKALADRLAEALAERMHERVRREFWGYAPRRMLDSEALIREEYRGIRPAPGYPACPDHTEKAAIWRLLDAERNAGIRLTESFAMFPTAAVSGFYFSHPQAHYFGVGQIDRDQVASYAQRKGICSRRAPNLAMARAADAIQATRATRATPAQPVAPVIQARLVRTRRYTAATGATGGNPVIPGNTGNTGSYRSPRRCQHTSLPLERSIARGVSLWIFTAINSSY
jgi:5-methyltetrahydrofolate--homocysteine methyltransferase